MSVLALDLGEKRTGIAASDVSHTVALPVTTLPTAEVVSQAASFRRLLAEHEVTQLVVGLPLSLDGTEQAQAARIRAQAQALAKATELPLSFQDERLTSAEAKRILHQAGYKAREQRGKTDTIAASILLQTWLDQHCLDQQCPD